MRASIISLMLVFTLLVAPMSASAGDAAFTSSDEGDISAVVGENLYFDGSDSFGESTSGEVSGVFDNPSFEQITTDSNGVPRPSNWTFGDSTTGESNLQRVEVQSRSDAPDGSNVLHHQYTATSFSPSGIVYVGQTVDLSNVNRIEFELYGEGGSSRAEHYVNVSGNQLGSGVTVQNGNIKTVSVDVSGFSGTHEVRFESHWLNSGDTLGNPSIDDVRTYGQSTTSITDYDWTFGDGSNATGEVVSHQYESAGEYTVELSASDDAGNSFTETKTVVIYPSDVELNTEFTAASVEELLRVGGGNLDHYVTVKHNSSTYNGTLATTTVPTNGTFEVNDSYQNGTIVVDDGSQSVVNLTGTYTITGAVDRVDGTTADSIQYYDYAEFQDADQQLRALAGVGGATTLSDVEGATGQPVEVITVGLAAGLVILIALRRDQ